MTPSEPVIEPIAEPSVLAGPVEPAPLDIVEPLIPYPLERFHDVIEYEDAADVAIGVVVPADFGLDWEYWRYLPDGLSLFFTRTPPQRKSVGVELAKAVGRPSVVAEATKTLNTLDPVATLYACTSGSFVRGLEGEREIREAMLAAGARHAVTSAGAAVEGLRACGAERISVASPYPKTLTERLVAFLEEAGFEVVSAHYLSIAATSGHVSNRTIRDLVRQCHHPRGDAAFVSCTALRTHGIVAELEHEIERPVFTANQVSLWAAVKAAGAEFLDPAQPGSVIGGGSPMARSTRLLIDAARRAAHEGAA